VYWLNLLDFLAGDCDADQAAAGVRRPLLKRVSGIEVTVTRLDKADQDSASHVAYSSSVALATPRCPDLARGRLMQPPVDPPHEHSRKAIDWGNNASPIPLRGAGFGSHAHILALMSPQSIRACADRRSATAVRPAFPAVVGSGTADQAAIKAIDNGGSARDL
jgi:hypothetical protein